MSGNDTGSASLEAPPPPAVWAPAAVRRVGSGCATSVPGLVQHNPRLHYSKRKLDKKQTGTHKEIGTLEMAWRARHSSRQGKVCGHRRHSTSKPLAVGSSARLAWLARRASSLLALVSRRELDAAAEAHRLAQHGQQRAACSSAMAFCAAFQTCSETHLGCRAALLRRHCRRRRQQRHRAHRLRRRLPPAASASAAQCAP